MLGQQDKQSPGSGTQITIAAVVRFDGEPPASAREYDV
jgi:hypothetical protein